MKKIVFTNHVLLKLDLAHKQPKQLQTYIVNG